MHVSACFWCVLSNQGHNHNLNIGRGPKFERKLCQINDLRSSIKKKKKLIKSSVRLTAYSFRILFFLKKFSKHRFLLAICILAHFFTVPKKILWYLWTVHLCHLWFDWSSQAMFLSAIEVYSIWLQENIAKYKPKCWQKCSLSNTSKGGKVNMHLIGCFHWVDALMFRYVRKAPVNVLSPYWLVCYGMWYTNALHQNYSWVFFLGFLNNVSGKSILLKW